MKSNVDLYNDIFGDEEDDNSIFDDSKFPTFEKEDFSNDELPIFPRAPSKRALDPSLTTGIYSGVEVSRKDFESQNFIPRGNTDGQISQIASLLDTLEKRDDGGVNEADFEHEEAVGGAIFEEMFKELQSGESDAVERLKMKRQKEVKKAHSVLNQKVMHTNLLKWRIEAERVFEKTEGMEGKERGELINGANQIIGQMLTLRDEEPSKYEEQKTMQDQWQNIDSSFEKFYPDAISSLNHWDRTTTLQGKNNEDTLQFKSINQTIGKRIENDVKNNMQQKIDKSMDRGMYYNDKPFFQSLVKEYLLEVGTNKLFSNNDDVQDVLEKQILKRSEESKIHQEGSVKRKKPKATRISKGRVLNFDVKPKLVGFTIPLISEEHQIPDSAQVLFDNLFGGGTVQKYGTKREVI